MRNERGTHVRDEREIARRRQQQQRNRARKRLFVFAALTWLLLAFNILFLLVLHTRVESMNENLEQTAKRLQLLQMVAEEGSIPEYQADAPAAMQPVTVDYVSKCELEKVEKPAERTPEQVLEKLEQLSEDSSLIEEICQNSSRYPDKLLEALANNPEMADFAVGYPKAEKKAVGGLTELEKAQDFPLFLQWDPRWGYAEYGDDSNIGLSGCGPTCLSMALYYLTGNETLTPDKIAEYSMKNGYYIAGTGTAWALMEDVPAGYGIGVTQPECEEQIMKKALDQGKIIICSMGPGDFTVGGHFVVIYGYGREGFYINDPNCVARSRQSWPFFKLEKQIKNIWVLSGE